MAVDISNRTIEEGGSTGKAVPFVNFRALDAQKMQGGEDAVCSRLNTPHANARFGSG